MLDEFRPGVHTLYGQPNLTTRNILISRSAMNTSRCASLMVRNCILEEAQSVRSSGGSKYLSP